MLAPDVAAIRNAVNQYLKDPKDETLPTSLVWSPTRYQLADCLTKDGFFQEFQEAMRRGAIYLGSCKRFSGEAPVPRKRDAEESQTTKTEEEEGDL
jgi:hypothetical protein